jgi:serine/threonine protein kinase
MSPEQAKAKGELTPATDLYSLGATFFHLLTGRPPFTSSSAKDILKKHVFEKAPDPRSFNPAVSEKAAMICQKLLEKVPQKRPSSGQELAVEIEGVLLERTAKKPASSRIVALRSPKRSERTTRTTKNLTRVSRFRVRKAATGTGGILAGAVAILVILFFLLGRSSPSLTTESYPAPEKIPAPERREAEPGVLPPKTSVRPTAKTTQKEGTKDGTKDGTKGGPPNGARKGTGGAFRPIELP